MDMERYLDEVVGLQEPELAIMTVLETKTGPGVTEKTETVTENMEEKAEEKTETKMDAVTEKKKKKVELFLGDWEKTKEEREAEMEWIRSETERRLATLADQVELDSWRAWEEKRGQGR